MTNYLPDAWVSESDPDEPEPKSMSNKFIWHDADFNLEPNPWDLTLTGADGVERLVTTGAELQRYARKHDLEPEQLLDQLIADKRLPHAPIQLLRQLEAAGWIRLVGKPTPSTDIS
jgi:hypothetical protein